MTCKNLWFGAGNGLFSSMLEKNPKKLSMFSGLQEDFLQPQLLTNSKKFKKRNTQKYSQKQQNVDQNIIDSKSCVWKSFLENIVSGTQLLYIYICSNVPVSIRVFLISDFLAESLEANRNQQKRSLILQYIFVQKTSFYSLDFENNMLLQHSQKLF